MAVTQIKFDKTTEQGRNIDRALRSVISGRDGLANTLAALKTMIDGDASDPAQFARMTAECGFPTDADSKAAWDELNSVASKIDTDNDVNFVATAIDQACAKFGIVTGF